jgi:hypothetical protein
MPKFTLEMDIRIHDHSPSAHRHVIGQMLAQVAQALGDGKTNAGDIVIPPGGSDPARTIGSWQIENAEPKDKTHVEA